MGFRILRRQSTSSTFSFNSNQNAPEIKRSVEAFGRGCPIRDFHPWKCEKDRYEANPKAIHKPVWLPSPNHFQAARPSCGSVYASRSGSGVRRGDWPRLTCLPFRWEQGQQFLRESPHWNSGRKRQNEDLARNPNPRGVSRDIKAQRKSRPSNTGVGGSGAFAGFFISKIWGDLSASEQNNNQTKLEACTLRSTRAATRT